MKILKICLLSILAFILFTGCTQDYTKEEADSNAYRCYEIATMNKVNESLTEEDKDLITGCIILPVSDQYWTYEKYGGSKNIKEVYWFYNRDNWNITDEGKISNFEEITEKNEIYGVYIIK